MNRNRFLIISGFIFLFTCKAGSQMSFTGQELGSDFTRGMELFKKEKYPAAIRLFDAYIRNNNNTDLLRVSEPEYFFRTGYSHYIRGEKSRALLMFSEIKDIDTEYTPPAVYYFSQIAYEEKRYETAMDGFTRLKDDETFGSV